MFIEILTAPWVMRYGRSPLSPSRKMYSPQLQLVDVAHTHDLLDLGRIQILEDRGVHEEIEERGRTRGVRDVGRRSMA